MASKTPGNERGEKACYEVCVVGAGMVGSNAAKHAAMALKSEGGTPAVCLIGPEEPKSRQGQTIFASYYDEARITRATAVEVSWAIVASRSIARYKDIEQESGLRFYEEVGCLTVGDPMHNDYVSRTVECAARQGVEVEQLTADDLRARFPYVAWSSRHVGVWERRNAGYINPRTLVTAQQQLAVKYGCDIIRDIVKSVEPQTAHEGIPCAAMRVTTDADRVIYAKKVLLATNVFTEGFRQLLPQGVHLNMQPIRNSVILAELLPHDLDKLKNMPSMVLTSCGAEILENAARTDRQLFNCYILPPVKYPDGKYYLKLGHLFSPDVLLSAEEITKWYIDPVPQIKFNELERTLRFTFPDIAPASLHVSTCATVNTPSCRPYIDLVTPMLGVAVGDNGIAARSCDELGLLATQLLLNGEWLDNVLRRDDFRAALRLGPKLDNH